MICKLSDFMPSQFTEIHRAFKSGSYSEVVLKGGRGSGKSSFASEEGIYLLLSNPNIHGVVMRKHENTLRRSVYAQYRWAIAQYGLMDYFTFKYSPLEMIYKPTGQKIMFFGVDAQLDSIAGNVKSIKVDFGHIGFLHLEELDQFGGEEEKRSIEQSILRGGDITFEISSFNPPRSRDNWANQYVIQNAEKPNLLIHHSHYSMMPENWLGKRFLDDAAWLKESQPDTYEHEYDGIPNSKGGAVFENVSEKHYTDKQILAFERVYSGVDWGWYPDPWAYNKVAWIPHTRELIVFAEEERFKTYDHVTADVVKKHIRDGERVTVGADDKKGEGNYRVAGIKAVCIDAYAGSRNDSFKWLQGLKSICIDRQRCPKTWDEFVKYEYEKTRSGEVISEYPDGNDHHIDAVRYATHPIWIRRGT